MLSICRQDASHYFLLIVLGFKNVFLVVKSRRSRLRNQEAQKGSPAVTPLLYLILVDIYIEKSKTS